MSEHSIRTVELQSLNIGGENSLQFKPFFCLEVSIFNPEENFQIVKDFYKTSDRLKLIQMAQEADCDILGLKFNISNISEVEEACTVLKSLLPEIKKPLMIRGVNNDAIDSELLPALTKIVDRQSIVAFANENTYKSIVPPVAAGGHIIVLRSPIDINLAKELKATGLNTVTVLWKRLSWKDLRGMITSICR